MVMNKVHFEDLWPSMRPTISKLLHQEDVTREEWQKLFGSVFNVCTWDPTGADKLHRNLQNIILDCIKQTRPKVLGHQEDQALLKAYVAEWRKYFALTDYMPLVLEHFESTLKGKKVKGSFIRKIILDAWSESIFSVMNHRLLTSAMKLVQSERNGGAFDSQLIIAVKVSYVNVCSDSEDKLQIYRENFAKAYIGATKYFYRIKALEYFEANGVQNYMKYADQKLKEEAQRASKYLESVSIGLLDECCVEVLVTAFKEVIVAECAGMIKNNETEKLQLMFRLIDRVAGGIAPMLKDLEDHIVSEGLADRIASANIITQSCEKYVEQLLGLYARFSKLVNEAFNNDPRFLTSRDKAFEHIVNDTSVFRLYLTSKRKSDFTQIQPESRSPELLANYCDMLLRKTPLSRKLASDEVEARLQQVVVLLKYVKNKDVFMMYYKAHLTRRLILESSADSEKEEYMVEWLRDVGMPADYINKFSRMFQDIKVVEDLNEQFKNIHRNNTNSVDSINIKILNAGAWSRASERVQVSLPLELEDFIPQVDDFYRQQYSGRKLQWYHHMSNGTITFTNKAGKYDLEVTTFQMAVLFAWNERKLDRISFEDLMLATQLPDIELRRTLWSLVAFPKLKRQVILYSPEVKSPRDFDYKTLFWINQEFSLIKSSKPQTRGKVNLIGKLQLSTQQSNQEDNEAILRLRILRTQEAIVKIMKMRKRISNAELQTELVEILKNHFLPSRNLIKEQIEWLIEHGYMKRDEDKINVFIYVI